MKIISKLVIFTTMLCIACVNRSYTRIEPENLIDFSSEQVSFSLSSPSVQEDVTNWLTNDQPTSVELGCTISNKTCSNIVKLLNLYGINYNFNTIDNKITLFYNKVVARDCNRISSDKDGNIIRSHNLGCAVSANIVQMVSDHKQFIEPSLLDLHDATKSVHHYNNTYLSNKH
ncbi:hypothetical protein NOVO_03895 [Rickettsiales bacterium Ac37b]|nr:hypothetical protein NOVO_03895 [Rickettsiales bacterium Ac37b]